MIRRAQAARTLAWRCSRLRFRPGNRSRKETTEHGTSVLCSVSFLGSLLNGGARWSVQNLTAGVQALWQAGRVASVPGGWDYGYAEKVVERVVGAGRGAGGARDGFVAGGGHSRNFRGGGCAGTGSARADPGEVVRRARSFGAVDWRVAEF